MRLKLREFKKLEWIELMDVTSPLRTLEKKSCISGAKRKLGAKPIPMAAETGDEDGEEALDAEDDFKREMHL